MNWRLRAAYTQSMWGLQTAALELYRAYRLQPSEDGTMLLQTVSALLREVTQCALGFSPLVPIMLLDADGTILRQSLEG